MPAPRESVPPRKSGTAPSPFAGRRVLKFARSAWTSYELAAVNSDDAQNSRVEIDGEGDFFRGAARLGRQLDLKQHCPGSESDGVLIPRNIVPDQAQARSLRSEILRLWNLAGPRFYFGRRAAHYWDVRWSIQRRSPGCRSAMLR